jgi:hypothetical protein
VSPWSREKKDFGLKDFGLLELAGSARYSAQSVFELFIQPKERGWNRERFKLPSREAK